MEYRQQALNAWRSLKTKQGISVIRHIVKLNLTKVNQNNYYYFFTEGARGKRHDPS